MKKLIGVIGNSNPNKKEYEIAVNIGSLIAQNDCILVCGGLGGVMEGASKGAKLNGGTTIGIIPGNDKNSCNKYIDIPIVTGFGEARNVIVVKTSHSIIAIGGSFGTLSEISFALKYKIPIVGINTWDVSEKIIKHTDPNEAFKTAYELAVNARGSIL
ncbi:MAG: TIGR00725 family protein [Candidatus Dadabacteria bacterium]|nr:TIGR00725 family protein [Candidatus Dadabacteria bacterium]NIQ13060.1 TIGR00725 family protein [Candidatus Dadabacteria bacterium]